MSYFENYIDLSLFLLWTYKKLKSFEDYQGKMVLVVFELYDRIGPFCTGPKNRKYCFDSEESHSKRTLQKVTISGSHGIS